MAPRKLKVACAGLGRMEPATPSISLTVHHALSSLRPSHPDEKEMQWAKTHLEPNGVPLYWDYDEMFKHPGPKAVVIATVTTVHAEQSIKAMHANRHVLCEKPLSTSVEVVCGKLPGLQGSGVDIPWSQSVVDAAQRYPHP